jgi:hypothetical protein
MQQSTYAEIFQLVEALGGVDSFTTDERAKILTFVNRRLYQAYRASEMWPRYVVAAQARPAPGGVVPWSYDAAAGVRTSSLATRNRTTVTLTLTVAPDVVVGMSVVVAGLTGTLNPNGTHVLTSVDGNVVTYELASGTGSETYSGTATMTPVVIPDIDSFIRIWNRNPYQGAGAYEEEFYVTLDGATIQGNVREADGFWVAFRKEWDGPYTEDSTTIPFEFREYAAHAAYADFLRMDGQVDKAMAEEQVAQQYLLLELDKAQHSRNINSIFRKITTSLGRQAR